MGVYQNLTGTTSKTFTIGKNNGVTFDTSVLVNKSINVLSFNKPLYTSSTIYLDATGTSYLNSLDYTGKSATTGKLASKINLNFSGALTATTVNTDFGSDVLFTINSLDASKLTNYIAWDRISKLVAIAATSDKNLNNGTSTLLSRSDHKHDGLYFPTNGELTFESSQITGNGTINDSIELTIVENSIESKHIKSVNPASILTGTIGSSSATVNLYGNASTATSATKLSGTAANVGNASLPVYFKNGIPIVVDGTLTVNITGSAGSATTATLDSESQNIAETYIKGISSSNATITITKGNDASSNITINNVNNATYASKLGTSTSNFTYKQINDKFTAIDSTTANLNTDITSLEGSVVKTIQINGSTVTNSNNTVNLPAYEAGATKTVISQASSNGYIKVNNTNIKVYELPSGVPTSVDSVLSSTSTKPLENKAIYYKFNNVSTSISEINTEITGIKESASLMQENIEGINDSIVSINSSITANASAINNVRTSVNTNTTNISKLSTSINTNANAISANASAINNLKTSVNTNASNISVNASGITSLKSDVSTINSNVSLMQGSIDGINNSIVSINSSITANASAINNVRTSVNTNTTNIATNASAIANINKSITSINSSLPKFVQKINVGTTQYSIKANTNGIVELPEYASGATKVETSTVNGQIKINGTAVTVYSLPTASSTKLGGVIVDSVLSSTSTNPLENKAIYEALTGNQTFTDLVVKGNLTVQGNTTTVETSNLTIEDQLIQLAKGNSSAIATPAGFYVEKYDGTNNGGIVFDKSGKAYVGTISLSNGLVNTSNSTLYELAQRSTTMHTNALTYWNGSRLETKSNITVSGNDIIAANFYGNASNAVSINVGNYSQTKEYLLAAISQSTNQKVYSNTNLYFIPNEGTQSLYTPNLNVTYNITANTVTATTFNGDLNGTANNATSLNGKAEGALSVSHAATATTANNATSLNGKAEGALSVSHAATADSATSANSADVGKTVKTTATSSGDYHIPLVKNSTSQASASIYVGNSQAFTFNPSTGVVTATTFSGSVSGNATSATSATYASKTVTTINTDDDDYAIPFVSSSAAQPKGASFYVGGSASTNKNVTFNPATGAVTATTFVGTLSGNASTATQAASLGTNAGSETRPVYFSGGIPVQTSTTLAISITGNAKTATTANNATSLNGKTESALSVSHASTATTATSADYASRIVTAVNTNDTSYFIPFVSSSAAESTGVSFYVGGSATTNKNVTFNPATGAVTATTFVGTLSGNASTASNLKGGAANKIAYQTANNKTSFINAPSSDLTVGLLTYNASTGFTWQDQEQLSVNAAENAKKITVANDTTNTLYITGVTASGDAVSLKKSNISIKNAALTLGNTSNSGSIIIYNATTDKTHTVASNTTATANTTLTLPAVSGVIDTIELRNSALSDYLPLSAGSDKSLSGGLHIYSANPQLQLASKKTTNAAKTGRITTLNYSGNSQVILDVTNSTATSAILNIGGANTQNSMTNINFYATPSTDLDAPINILSLAYNKIEAKSDIMPNTNTAINIGSSALQFNNIYGNVIYENNTELSKKYMNGVSSVATTVNTGAYIKSISYSNGVLTVSTATPPNSDSKVSQVITSNNNFYPLLFHYSGAATVEDIVGINKNAALKARYYTNIFVNPATGILYSNKLIGDVEGNLTGNADTATQAVSLGTNAGSTTLPVYFSGGKPVATATTLGVSITGNAATATTANNATSLNNKAEGELSVSHATTADRATNATNLVVLSSNSYVNMNIGSSTHPIYIKDGKPTLVDSTINLDISGKAATAGTADVGNKVKTSATSSDDKYYIPLVKQSTSQASTSIYVGNAQAFTFNPSTGVVSAPTFSGALVGNASTATSATSAGRASHIAAGAANQIPYQVGVSTTGFISAWASTSTTDQILVVAANSTATKAPTWISSPYVKLDGSTTLTGALKLKANVKEDSLTSGGLDANNSNIYDVKAIYFGSNANTGPSYSRGLNFFNSSSGTTTYVDTIYASANKLYFAPKRTIGATKPTSYEVIHTNNLATALTSTNILDAITANINSKLNINTIPGGPLTVKNGGTGASTFTKNQLLVGNGDGVISEVPNGAENQFLMATSNAKPAFTSLSTDYISDLDNWTGSGSINTVGTIDTGIWNGSRINLDYLDSSIDTHISDTKQHLPAINGTSSTSTEGLVLLSNSNNTASWSTTTLDSIIGTKASTVADSRINAKLNGNVVVKGNLTTNKNLVVACTATVSGATALNSTLSVSGAATFASNVTVNGNLTVNGDTFITNTTTVSSEDHLIELGRGRDQALTTPAGFFVPKYDGTNAGALVFDATGTAYVGDATITSNNIDVSKSSLQPLATRVAADQITDGAFMKWDATNLRLTPASNLSDVKYLPMAAGTANKLTGVLYAPLGVAFQTQSSAASNTNIIYVNASGSTVGSMGANSSGDIGMYAYAGNNIYLRPAFNTNSNNGIIIKPTEVIPGRNNVTALGSSNAKFTTVYAETFDGKATYASKTVTTVKTSGEYAIPFVSSSGAASTGVSFHVGGSESTNKNVTFNPATGAVKATTFVGALSGNATSATSASTASKLAVSNYSSVTGYLLAASISTGTGVTVYSNTNLHYTASTQVLVAPNINVTNTVSAATFVGNLTGTASNATKDSDGNVIKDTYMPKSGGEFTGPINFTSNDALPNHTSLQYVLGITKFTDGGTVGWTSVSDLNSGTADFATSAGYLKTDTTAAQNKNQFIAASANKSLTIYTANTGTNYSDITRIVLSNEPYIFTGVRTASASYKSSTTTYLLTPNNIATYAVTSTNIGKHAITALNIKYSTNSVPASITNGVATADITSIIPTAADYEDEFITIKTDQNVPSKKSFGSGITIGSCTSTTGTTYSSSGCTMSYNSTKKCMQFIFA